MSVNVNIIGVGSGGLNTLSKDRISEIYKCNILIASKRYLEQVDGISAQKIPITKELDMIIDSIKGNDDKDIVVLASGDPNLYGISDFILRNIPYENVIINPNVSSMQEAFAASRVSMNEAFIFSVHGREVESVVDACKINKKIGLFTSDGKTPGIIANLLKVNTNFDFDIYVCEDLGFETENVSMYNLSNFPENEFSPLNVMILIRKDEDEAKTSLKPRKERRKGVAHFGLPDSEFSHRDSMITKAEVRALDISKLKLYGDSVVWDIGAGCGSISIEVASIVYNGAVYAVERDNSQLELLKENIKKFELENITVIKSAAPDGLDELPNADRIFIGGSGGNLRKILQVCKSKLNSKGIIIINAVTLNTLIEGTAVLKELNFNVEVFAVNISRTKDLNGNKLFKATNPVYIITGNLD